MTDQHPTAAGEAPAVPTAEPGPGTSDKSTEPCGHNPYLKIFGADIGAFEFVLPDRPITIGRSDHVDIRLPDQRVSRLHATITGSQDRFKLVDAGSTCGTIVNGKDVEDYALKHGDSIQIGGYLLQFRTHPALPGAAAAARAKLLLRSDFCTLPSTMRLKFRTLAIDPGGIFESGDTLRIGHGGLLVPTPTAPDDGTCLELRLSWSTRVSKQYLGEIIGVIQDNETHWICVKLHTVSEQTYDATVAGGQPGPWVDVLPS